jgi:hypothetical protein
VCRRPETTGAVRRSDSLVVWAHGLGLCLPVGIEMLTRITRQLQVCLGLDSVKGARPALYGGLGQAQVSGHCQGAGNLPGPLSLQQQHTFDLSARGLQSTAALAGLPESQAAAARAGVTVAD